MRMNASFSHLVCKILMEQNQWALHLFLCGLDQTVKQTGNDVIPARATLQEVLLDLPSWERDLRIPIQLNWIFFAECIFFLFVYRYYK